MSQRIVNDPSQHGWVEENGKWVWEGGVNIEDGTVQGQITTWDVAEKEWTADSSLTIDSNGDATFSGTVDAAGFTVKTTGYSKILADGTSSSSEHQYVVNNHSAFRIVDATTGSFMLQKGPSAVDDVVFRIQPTGNAKFSGTVDAAGFTVNGQPISGGGGLPDGGYTYGWNITATDFIATSDERAKDNITTVPVGLIDSLKGREWEWKESGEKGSGVVAQELEQVLPHLVHEDDDGMKSVSYMGLCAYLIEELKDCRERLAVLEAKE